MNLPPASRLKGILVACLVLMLCLSYSNQTAKEEPSMKATILTDTTRTIYMNSFTPEGAFTDYTADGYLTKAFQAWYAYYHLNYTLTITEDRYYDFSLLSGDLAGESPPGQYELLVNETFIGVVSINSIGSGSTTTFNGHSQQTSVGELRLAVGWYILQIINVQQVGYETENLIAVKYTPTTRVVPPLLFKFAYFSDPHFDETPGAWSYPVTYESKNSTYDVIGQINAMNPLPKFVLLGGDWSQYGDLYNLTYYREALDTLTMPYFLTAGNHDDGTKATFGAAIFSDLFPEFNTGQFYYYRDVENVRIVCLDTGEVGYQGVSSAQMAWLNTTVDTDRSIFVWHHFPMQFWTWEACNQREAIKDILESHSNVVADFNGHLHGDYTTVENGILYRGIGSLIRYPVNYAVIDVYGTSIDSEMCQVTNRRYIVNNQGMSATEYYSTIGFGGWTAGLYQDVSLTFDNSGQLLKYDRPVRGHTYLVGGDLDASIYGMTSGQLVLTPRSWSASLIQFNASASSGFVTIFVSGLSQSRLYAVRIDGLLIIPSTPADRDGIIAIDILSWSIHQVEVTGASSPNTPTTAPDQGGGGGTPQGSGGSSSSGNTIVWMAILSALGLLMTAWLISRPHQRTPRR